MGGLLGDGVVARKRVWSDNEIAVRTSGDRNADGRGQSALGTTAVDDLADGADVEGVTLEHLDEGFFELGSAGGVEELKQAMSAAAEVLATVGDVTQEGLTGGRGLGEAIESAVFPGAFLLGHEALDMLGCRAVDRGPRSERGWR